MAEDNEVIILNIDARPSVCTLNLAVGTWHYRCQAVCNSRENITAIGYNMVAAVFVLQLFDVE